MTSKIFQDTEKLFFINGKLHRYGKIITFKRSFWGNKILGFEPYLVEVPEYDQGDIQILTYEELKKKVSDDK